MKRIKVLKVAIVVGIIVGVVAYIYGSFLFAWYSPPPLAFSGNSSDLKQTVIVPTLDTRIPPGKSAIWCGSFHLAWNAMKDTIVKEPIRLSNAQPIVDELNASPFSAGDLDAGTYYAAAGPLTDEFVQSAKRNVRKRYPRLSPSLDGLHSASDGLLAFAALEVASRFTMPYLQNPDPLEFTDSAGNSTKLSSFGVLSKYDGRSSIELRKQPAVL